MGTNRMIKSRINRFFESVPGSQGHSLQVVGRWQNVELLKDLAVREEIERYRWIESEKEGGDIGGERANSEWLSRYAAAWQRSRLLRKYSLREL